MPHETSPVLFEKEFMDRLVPVCAIEV